MFIDIHIIQSLPSSNVNRDDTGSPKTALYGGVRRHRVSSQSWKRATREAFPSIVPAKYLGTRTKRALDLVADEISRQAGTDVEDPMALAESLFSTLKIAVGTSSQGKDNSEQKRSELKALFFLSTAQVAALAELAIGTKGKPKKADIVHALKADNAFDMALFGRMVADAPELNIDAACQVAHAISTHSVETEFDYFTGLDDIKARSSVPESGAGMIGTTEFVSSCLYRYCTLNTSQLVKNLEDESDARIAIKVFLEAFISSMPSGKVNSFANNTLPSAVYVSLRKAPMSLVGAFETAIRNDLDSGYVGRSVHRLVDYAEKMHSVYGSPSAHFGLIGDDYANDLERLTQDLYSVSDLCEKVALSALPLGDD